MTQRIFSLQDQKVFAELSGDWNPFHLDSLYARRCLGGQIAVHGIHALLWALDTWLRDYKRPVCLQTLEAVFSKPISLQELVTFSFVPLGTHQGSITLTSQGTPVVDIEIAWHEGKKDASEARPEKNVLPRHAPKEWDVTALESGAGALTLSLETEAAGRLFPNLVSFLPLMDVATLLHTSRLVGMECPGLNSLYSELSLVSTQASSAKTLNYKVKKWDKRFALTVLEVSAPNLEGSIKAFLRPEPQKQLSYKSVTTRVAADAFAGQKAFIVGGSRGLGELVAKILAAGGAQVAITYHQGYEDARRIVEDIISNGGKAELLSWDVAQAASPTLSWQPTHLYYFATPYIFSGRKGKFSTALFEKFCRYYVSGFAETLEKLHSKTLRYAFYPSTVAIDESPSDMGEYAAAKAAGENFCGFAKKIYPGLTIVAPRLPRVATDQTASLAPVDNQDPLPILLDLLQSSRVSNV